MDPWYKKYPHGDDDSNNRYDYTPPACVGDGDDDDRDYDYAPAVSMIMHQLHERWLSN